jgi:N-acetylglucosamine kinase-like BadF-type ATPase
VSRAAHAGDVQIMTLFFRAADELAKIVHAVYDRLDIPVGTRVNVSHSGGMFSERELLLEPFLANLSKDARTYRVAPPRLPPVAGAAVYAAKLSGAPLVAQAIHQLESHFPQKPAGTQIFNKPTTLGADLR